MHNILQVNLRRARLAHDSTLAFATKMKYILIIPGRKRKILANPRWIVDSKNDTEIRVLKRFLVLETNCYIAQYNLRRILTYLEKNERFNYFLRFAFREAH